MNTKPPIPTERSLFFMCSECNKETISLTHQDIVRLFGNNPEWMWTLNYGTHAICLAKEML